MRPIVRERILEQCHYKCVYCGATENLEVDHIIPLSKGGRHDEDNFQILCKSCNLKKGRGVNYETFFKIGISPEYIEISPKWIDILLRLTAKENKSIIKQMFKKNDIIFSDKVS